MSLNDTRVLVVGDILLDRQLHGSLGQDATSVPRIAVEREETAPGGAGHVAVRVASLGCSTTLVGVVGLDAEGSRLREALTQAGVCRLELVEQAGLPTLNRIQVWTSSSAPHLRLDLNSGQKLLEQSAELLWQRLGPLLATHDVVVIADSDRGTISPVLAAAIITECRRRRLPCVVTTRRELCVPFAGATVLMTEARQVERLLGQPLSTATETRLKDACRSLGWDGLVIIQAPHQLTLATPDGVTHIAPCLWAGADVHAAQESVTAVLAASLGAGHDLVAACRRVSELPGPDLPSLVLASSALASSALASSALASSALASSEGTVAGNTGHDAVLPAPRRKVCDQDEARDWIVRQKLAGRRVVFTNGCFDILHAGHVACLEQARRQGDLLVVGLNSDASVRLNKGPERPIISEHNRATLLAALACVDLVVLFDELTPELLVRHLDPDVLVKGGDYANVPIAGADFVRSRGGRVVLIPLVEGLSTTRILEASRGHGD